MAVATRCGEVQGMIFHHDRGSRLGFKDFRAHCTKLGIDQSVGRVESCHDSRIASGASPLEVGGPAYLDVVHARPLWHPSPEADTALADRLEELATRAAAPHSGGGIEMPRSPSTRSGEIPCVVIVS